MLGQRGVFTRRPSKLVLGMSPLFSAPGNTLQLIAPRNCLLLGQPTSITIFALQRLRTTRAEVSVRSGPSCNVLMNGVQLVGFSKALQGSHIGSSESAHPSSVKTTQHVPAATAHSEANPGRNHQKPPNSDPSG